MIKLYHLILTVSDAFYVLGFMYMYPYIGTIMYGHSTFISFQFFIH